MGGDCCCARCESGLGSSGAAVVAGAAAAAVIVAEEDALAAEPEGRRMILRTTVPPVSPAGFLGLGMAPRGAIVSSTPYRINPASSKLGLACTDGSSHRAMNALEPSLAGPLEPPSSDPFKPPVAVACGGCAGLE